MEIFAYAKINLILEVIGKRSDGYHELITLMCAIGLHDTVRLFFEGNRITLSCSHPDIPADHTNLAHIAARRFFDAIGHEDGGVHIEIDKVIPTGAGLGGGSTDAAAVLTALNRHYGQPLSTDRLMTIAASIGADVPFFIFGKPAVATGIGDVLTPYPNLPPFHLVLIYPAMAVSTAQVYKKLNLRLTKNKKIPKRNIFELDWETGIQKQLHNDLEPAASTLCPDIDDAKRQLLANGAAGALMSGSGSSVYGLFTDPDSANQAYKVISRYRRWQAFLTQLRV